MQTLAIVNLVDEAVGSSGAPRRRRGTRYEASGSVPAAQSFPAEGRAPAIARATHSPARPSSGWTWTSGTSRYRVVPSQEISAWPGILSRLVASVAADRLEVEGGGH